MKINKTIPKDKSSYVYYADKGRDLIATKPLLIIYKLTNDEVSFRRGQYVHSQKEWLDWDSFPITKDEFIGWVDISDELNLPNLL